VVDLLEDMLSDARVLLIAAIVVVAIWSIATTWMRTRAVVPTIGAVLLSAIVVWGAAKLDTTLKDRVNEDVDRYQREEPGQRRSRGG
jgi:hypothetical protein